MEYKFIQPAITWEDCDIVTLAATLVYNLDAAPGSAEIRWSVSGERVEQVVLFSADGRAVETVRTGTARGGSGDSGRVSVSHLPPGIYALRFTLSDDTSFTHLVSIQ